MIDCLTREYRNVYWKIRDKYLSTSSKLLRLFLYVRLKRIENNCNCDLGTSFHDRSTKFEEHPYLPHGLNGIVISRLSEIGKNVTIFHQVTIGIKARGGG